MSNLALVPSTPAEAESEASRAIDASDAFAKKSAVPAFVEAARSIVITDQESRDAAAAFRADLKARDKVAETHYTAIKNPLNAAKDAVLAAEKSVRGPIKEALSLLDPKILAFEKELARREAEERARLEEEARKIEEARRLAEAQVAVENGVPEAEALETLDAPILSFAAPAPAAPRPAGQSIARTWDAELVSMKRLVAFIVTGSPDQPLAHPEWIGLVDLNTTKAREAARSQGADLAIPGLRAVPKESVRTRRS